MSSSSPKRTIAGRDFQLLRHCNVGVAEHALDLVVQRPLVVEQAARGLPRPFKQRAIGAQLREGEVGEAGLARPEQLALAADLEVGLGELEAVVRADERLEARRARTRSAPPWAARRAGSTTARRRGPTRPRSWWSWASPKRSASWTIMIVAFGTSTPTSITVVATSTSSSRALKRPIRSRRSRGAKLSVQAPDAQAAQLGAAEPLGLLLGRARLDRLRLGDERADHERLPPLLEMAAKPAVGLGAASPA